MLAVVECAGPFVGTCAIYDHGHDAGGGITIMPCNQRQSAFTCSSRYGSAWPLQGAHLHASSSMIDDRGHGHGAYAPDAPVYVYVSTFIMHVHA